MKNVTKCFGEVLANNKVNLELRRGEILSLLGENGSGKTTLMNMLAGIYYPDDGQIYVNGRAVTICSPKDAFDLGIGMRCQSDRGAVPHPKILPPVWNPCLSFPALWP